MKFSLAFSRMWESSNMVLFISLFSCVSYLQSFQLRSLLLDLYYFVDKIVNFLATLYEWKG